MRIKKQRFIILLIKVFNRKRNLIILFFLVFALLFIFFNKFIILQSKLVIEKAELFYITFQNKDYPNTIKEDFKIDELIAHAGGGINGLDYTNSLEALEQSYKNGFRFFEVDIEWTKDKQLALIHDWDKSVEILFSIKPLKLSLNEFKEQKMVNDLTQLTLDEFLEWLDKDNKIYIITDIRYGNEKALKIINQKAPHLKEQIIPQIYSFTEYSKIRSLGYDKIIISLYKRKYLINSLMKFLENHQVTAVSMPVQRVSELLPILNMIEVKTLVHTINNESLKNQLIEVGVDGFYTDFLIP